MDRRRAAVAAGAAVAVVLPGMAGVGTASATTTQAAPSAGVTVLARGLDGPFGMQFTGGSTVVVAESVSGEITRVSTATGAQRTLVRGLPGPAAVAVQRGSAYIALGGPAPDAPPPAPGGRYPQASILKARADGTGVRVLSDLLRYELARNPDGQVQFVKGKPVEALANPFALSASGYGLLVADGGANAVLRVGRLSGRTSTFFVPPNVRTPACLRPGVQANPGSVGCDSVPTGVTVARGSIYVSTLGSDVPGAARIYRLDPRNGRVLQIVSGLTGITGVAVAPDGTIYASHVFEGAPAGPPAPGFDPSSVGQIVRIAPDGRRTTAQVTMPLSLAWHDGALYSTAWSVGMPKAGQIVRVASSAFR